MELFEEEESRFELSKKTAMKKTFESTFCYCGRVFSGVEIAWIRELIAGDNWLNRLALSRLVCMKLGWLRLDGRLKEMSCRVAMLRMEKDGLITLPPPQKRNGNGRTRPRQTAASDPGDPISLPAGSLSELLFRPVVSRPDSSLWNELIERYHYLGYKPLPGDQMRYLVFSGPQLLAALGFGSAAWKIAPRDQFIGWSQEERSRHLHLLVNNARFLVLPWVKSRNLASRILSGVAKKLPLDWEARYGYRPVMLETFVDRERFRGTCYRAANWIFVGQTQGRGKLDRQHLHSLPVKDILLYPLHRNFRQELLGISR
jgi:hypothetical protein